jgi:sugar lactone lactonase YvrE
MEMTTPQVLMTGISFGESPRWHDGRLWFADWGAQELIAVDTEGASEVVLGVDSFPFCIDWLSDGRLLVVSAREQALLRQEPDGSLVRHADLSGLSEHPWNEIVVDGRGNAYVNNIGFDLGAGDFAPGLIAVVTADGSARQVADGIAFPNGMAITPDGSTLIVAESYAAALTAFDIEADGDLSNRRIWAELGEGAAPDGICLDAEGAVWYGDVPNRHCRRVAEGGEVLETIELDRGCFACALGGDDGRTLFMVTREWNGLESVEETERSGQIVTAPAPAPRAPTPLKNV